MTEAVATLPTMRSASAIWWRIGCLSFGGPAGQIALMHSELVERRRLVDEASFTHGLNYCMLLPGPEAMQLACYLGWRMHGNLGGLMAGALFVLPGAALMLLLSWLFIALGTLPAAAGVLLGLQAAVLGIVFNALQRIGRKMLKTRFALLLALAALLGLAWLQLPFPLLLLLAAFAGALAARVRPSWLPATGHAVSPPSSVSGKRRLAASASLALALVIAWWLPLFAVAWLVGADSTAWAMALFFSKAALVTFGGAYAVLPYVAQQAVETYAWLAPGQMLVGLGLAESTPGPLILVLQFVGFVGGWQHPDLASPLLSALLCAGVVVWATFLPSFLFVLPAAPWIERLRELPLLAGALAGVGAAVVGVIANLAIWFAIALLRSVDLADAIGVLLIAAASWFALQKDRVPLPLVVVCAGLLGALAAAFGWGR